jgi:hypothetical protein
MNNRINRLALISCLIILTVLFSGAVSAATTQGRQTDERTNALLDEYAPPSGEENPSIVSEVGTNDFRISFNAASNSQGSAIAYNEDLNEYFVVWSGNAIFSGTNSEKEIFGRRIDASTGALLGDMIRISDMGVDGSGSWKADTPSVAYNSTNDEYLVVWYGDDNSGSMAYGEFEIFGQRIDASTGAEVGTNDFRISNIGTDGVSNYDATNPDVIYNPTDNEYLVTFRGGGGSSYLYNIYGQRLDASTGAEVGTNDFQISNTYRAFYPVAAFNAADNEYFIVWHGGGETPIIYDIYGQRLSNLGTEIGTEIKLSDMGADGVSGFDAQNPRIAYNNLNNSYLVVWEGDDQTDGEFEIFGQLITNDGVEIGQNDFQISDMGPDGDTAYDALRPDVVYNTHDNHFIVTWSGDDNIAPLVVNENEMFGQLVYASGVQIGENDFRISDMGPDGDITYHGFNGTISYNSVNNEVFVTWEGDDHLPPETISDEIYGQILAGFDTVEHPPSAVPDTIAASDGTYSIQVSVDWDEVADADTYNIFRDTDPAGATMTQIGSTYASSFRDYTVADLQPYYYWINSCNAVGCSLLSGPDGGYADASVAGILFQDGFETGDFSQWSQVNLGSGFLTVCSEASMNGSWGACVDRGTNDNRKVLIDDTPVDQTSFSVRFNMDINSFSMPEGTRFRFLETKQGLPRAFFLVLRRLNGQYQIQFNILVDGQIKSKSAWYNLSDAPHTLEIDWQAASADGANDGYIQLYMDDTLLEEMTALDNDTHVISSLRIGFIGRLDGSPVSGIWHVDDVTTGNNGYLGLP